MLYDLVEVMQHICVPRLDAERGVLISVPGGQWPKILVRVCGPTPKSGGGRLTENGGGESEGPKTGGGQLSKKGGGFDKCLNVGGKQAWNQEKTI